MNPQPSKQITLDLTEFLLILFGRAQHDNKVISNKLANLLIEADPSEQFIHVQYPEDDNNPLEVDLDSPVVWQIKPWHNSTEKYLARKELADLERSVRLNVTEVSDKVARYLVSISGGEYDDCKYTATRIVGQRALDKLKALGVSNFKDLLEADKILSEYKRKNSIK